MAKKKLNPAIQPSLSKSDEKAARQLNQAHRLLYKEVSKTDGSVELEPILSPHAHSAACRSILGQLKLIQMRCTHADAVHFLNDAFTNVPPNMRSAMREREGGMFVECKVCTKWISRGPNSKSNSSNGIKLAKRIASIAVNKTEK